MPTVKPFSVQQAASLTRATTNQLLRAHVPRRPRDGTARVRRGAAIRDVRQPAERVEPPLRIRGKLAVVERLTADQHRVVQVTGGEEKEPLKVARRKQSTPDTVLGVRNARENLRLHRGLHVREGIARSIERHVLEEQRQAIEWLYVAQLPHRRPLTVD